MKIRSMTGYGRGQKQLDGRDILVEIKSVNSRFLEQNVRISRNYTYLEEELKNLVKTKVSRGKTEISVTVNLVEGKKADIKVNEEMVRGYLEAMREYNRSMQEEKYHLSDDYDNVHLAFVSMKWANMLQLPDIFRIEKVQENEE